MFLFVNCATYPLRDLVHLVVLEVVVGVKMLVFEHSLADHLVGHLALQVHHVLEHLVVGLAGEEDATSVQLVDGAGYRPQVYRVVVPHSNDWK